MESYLKQHRVDEAISVGTSCVEMRKMIFGLDHEATWRSMTTLARAYKEEGRLADAEKELRTVLASMQKVESCDKEDMEDVKNSLALICSKLEDMGISTG